MRRRDSLWHTVASATSIANERNAGLNRPKNPVFSNAEANDTIAADKAKPVAARKRA